MKLSEEIAKYKEEIRKLKNKNSLLKKKLVFFTKETNESASKFILDHSKALLKNFILQSLNAIVIVDQKGKVVLINKCFSELFNVKEKQIKNHYIWDLQYKNLIPSRRKKGVKEKIKKDTLSFIKNKKLEKTQLEGYLLDGKGNTLFIQNLIFKIQTNNHIYIGYVIVDFTQRKKTEDELKNYKENLERLIAERTKELLTKQEFLEKLFDLSPNMQILYRLEDAVILDVNKSFLESTGLKRSEVIRKKITELNVWDKEDLIVLFKQLKKSGTIRNLEINYKNKEGENCYSLMSIDLIEIDNKQTAISFFVDISERKKAEERIKESTNIYRVLFQSSNDAVFLMKKEKYISCNKKATEIFQCNYFDIINHTPFDFSPEFQADGTNSRKKVLEIIEALLKEKKTNNFEWLHIHKDGSMFDAEISLTIFELNNEEYIQAIVRDISERKRHQRELEENELRFRTIFESSQDGIVITDSDQKIIEINTGFCNIVGCTRENILASNLNLILNSTITKEIYNNIEEKEIITKKNELKFIEIFRSSIDYMGKKATLNVIRDITERKHFEQKVLEASFNAEENERKRLADDLHDEVGPLVSSLKLYASAISELDKNPEKQHLFINNIQEISGRISTTVREISSSLSPTILINFGLHTAIKSLLSHTEDFIKIDYQSNIETNRFAASVEIVIYRIIKELLNNTLKHAQASLVEIIIIYNNTDFRLIYTDNGKGFDFIKEMQNKKEGLGLYSIINRCKSIKAEYQFSENEPNGICFELTIKNI